MWMKKEIMEDLQGRVKSLERELNCTGSINYPFKVTALSTIGMRLDRIESVLCKLIEQSGFQRGSKPYNDNELMNSFIREEKK